MFLGIKAQYYKLRLKISYTALNQTRQNIIDLNHYFRDNFRDRSRDGRRNHDDPPNSKIRTRPCKFFMERGTCRDGDRCTFIHQQKGS